MLRTQPPACRFGLQFQTAAVKSNYIFIVVQQLSRFVIAPFVSLKTVATRTASTIGLNFTAKNREYYISF